MDEPEQDSPMPDRSTESERTESVDLINPVHAHSSETSEQSVESMSRSNSTRGTPQQIDEAVNAAASTLASSWSTNLSSSSSESSKETCATDTVGWFPISEDSGVASRDEIAHLEAIGESSALDDAHWTDKFTELSDPEYVVSEQGKIEWTIKPFNGTSQNPQKDYVYISHTVRIGGYSWRLKVFPKGLEGPYLAVNLECQCDDDDSAEGWNSVTTDAVSEKPSLEPSNTQSSPSVRPWRIPAQFEVVVYNPEEPRVHFHKGSSQSFSEKSPSCSFKRFMSVNIMDIGMRFPHQRQALFRNDTLGIVAYVRTFRDETGCLFLRNTEIWDSFKITGFRGIRANKHRSPNSQGLVSAISTWLYLPPLIQILASAKAARVAQSTFLEMPVSMALLRMSTHMTATGVSAGYSAELEDIESALAWHGIWVQDSADVFEAWALLKGALLEELKLLSSKSLLDEFLSLDLSHLNLPYDTSASIKDVQGLISNNYIAKENDVQDTNTLGIPQVSCSPKVLHVQLPRQRFDTERRRWKKSRRAYELNEYLTYPAPYKLHSIVTHEDHDLKSRSLSTIVRADGQNFYKYGSDYERVVRLTRQQALVHTQTLSYAAVYVLDNEQSRVAQVTSKTGPPEMTELMENADSSSLYPVTLTFVDSAAFCGSEHPGFIDQYNIQSKDILQITLNTEEDSQKINAAVTERFLSNHEDRKICYIWELDECWSRFKPEFLASGSVAQRSLFRRTESGLFWVYVGYREEIEPVKSTDPEMNESISAGVLKPTENSAADVKQEDSTTTNAEPENCNDAPEDTTMTDVARGLDTSRIEIPGISAFSSRYVLIKYFDPESQSLRGVHNYIATRNQRTHLSIRENAPFLFDIKREYAFWEETVPNTEISICVGVAKVDDSEMIWEEEGEFTKIVIVQPVLSQAEKDRVGLEGGIVELQDFLECMYIRYFDPGKVVKSDKVTQIYKFGEPWYEGTFSRGVPHGHGKEITLSGEEYIGGFKMGLRNGKGLLKLQNNNTYEGDFWDGQPHGTGKHVEALTGNTYTGGFQRGKKRGRGTTEWQQAEEEAKVCRICYDSEQDCAFYPCGHVCACLECAKMANTCPMCHREGSRPFKLYFAN